MSLPWKDAALFHSCGQSAAGAAVCLLLVLAAAAAAVCLLLVLAAAGAAECLLPDLAAETPASVFHCCQQPLTRRRRRIAAVAATVASAAAWVLHALAADNAAGWACVYPACSRRRRCRCCCRGGCQHLRHCCLGRASSLYPAGRRLAPGWGPGSSPPRLPPTAPSRRSRTHSLLQCGRVPTIRGRWPNSPPPPRPSITPLSPLSPPVPLCSLDGVSGRISSPHPGTPETLLLSGGASTGGCSPPGEPLWQTAGWAAHPVGTRPEGWMVLQDVAGEPLLLHLSPSLPTLNILSCLTTRGPSSNARSGSPASHIDLRPDPTSLLGRVGPAPLRSGQNGLVAPRGAAG